MLYIWYPKNRTDLNIIHEENNVIETPEELMNVKKKLTYLFNNENGASKSLRDSLSFVIKLYNTPIKRLQHS